MTRKKIKEIMMAGQYTKKERKEDWNLKYTYLHQHQIHRQIHPHHHLLHIFHLTNVAPVSWKT